MMNLYFSAKQLPVIFSNMTLRVLHQRLGLNPVIKGIGAMSRLIIATKRSSMPAM